MQQLPWVARCRCWTPSQVRRESAQEGDLAGGIRAEGRREGKGEGPCMRPVAQRARKATCGGRQQPPDVGCGAQAG